MRERRGEERWGGVASYIPLSAPCILLYRHMSPEAISGDFAMFNDDIIALAMQRYTATID